MPQIADDSDGNPQTLNTPAAQPRQEDQQPQPTCNAGPDGLCDTCAPQSVLPSDGVFRANAAFTISAPSSGRRGWRDRGWRRSRLSQQQRRSAASEEAGRQIITIQAPFASPVAGNDLERAKRTLASLSGIDASVHPSGSAVLIRFTPGSCPMMQVATALSGEGFSLDTARCSRVVERPVTLTRSATPKPSFPAAVFRGLRVVATTVKGDSQLQLVSIAGVLLLTGALSHWFGVSAFVWAPMLLLSAVLSSTRTAPEAWESVRSFRVNIDVLMFAAAAGAAALGHYEEGVFLLFLFGLGAAGEHAALDRAERAISSLAAMAPDTANVVDESTGNTTELPVEAVSVGSVIVVRPFDRVPLDGSIIEGRSAIDESTLTGEPTPVDKAPGDQVFAGTMNSAGSLRVRVDKPASASTIARILEMVEEARSNASPVERFTERVERWYVPMVFVMTGFVLAIPPLLLGAEWGRSFYRSMAFMTAASPCALAIGTPAAILCGLARARSSAC